MTIHVERYLMLEDDQEHCKHHAHPHAHKHKHASPAPAAQEQPRVMEKVGIYRQLLLVD